MQWWCRLAQCTAAVSACAAEVRKTDNLLWEEPQNHTDRVGLAGSRHSPVPTRKPGMARLHEATPPLGMSGALESGVNFMGLRG